MWNPISFSITAEHKEILTECRSLSVSKILLNIKKSLLNMEPYQFPDYCWTWGYPYGMQKPISSPNIAENGEIFAEHGALSVSRLLLNMGKSLRNAEAYQFPQILLNMEKSLLNVEPYQFPHYYWTWGNPYLTPWMLRPMLAACRRVKWSLSSCH